MSKEFRVDIPNLDKWKEWLDTVDKEAFDGCKSRILRSAALRGLEYAQDLTPRRTSRLAGSLSMGAKDNYFDMQINSKGTSLVTFGTNVEYAAYVEEGFDQSSRKGDFIPGYWSSGTFHYDPEASGGMILTGKVIPGAHMFRKAMDHLEGDLGTITEFELRRLYDMLNRGGP